MAEQQKEQKKWWKTVVTLGGDALAVLLGGLLGAQWAKKEEATTKIVEQAGAELKRILTPDREDVMKELLLLGDEGASLVELLKEANEQGFIAISNKHYTENWIVNMLLKIEPQDRSWVYTLLNDICERDRKELFTHLEILCNDGWIQWLKVFKTVVNDGLKKLSKSIKVVERLEQLNQKATELAQEIEQKVQNPSRFGRIANRLFK